MSIKVYYSCLEKESLRFKEPSLVLKDFSKNKSFSNSDIYNCPAFINSLKNTFSLKSIYEYSFDVYHDRVESSYYNEDFFDRHVNIRSLENKIFSFNQWITFFTEENSLELNANIYPFLENNNITERCLMPPGQFDIGKWFRNIEFVFQLRPNFNQFKIEEDEVYQYIKFNTKNKIELIPYYHDSEISDMLKSIIDAKNFTKTKRNLNSYYEYYKIKKIVAKKIKNNSF